MVAALPAFVRAYPQNATNPPQVNRDQGISRDAILKWLDAKKQNRNLFNEYTLISRIRIEGLSFEPTEQDKDEFRKRGGSEKLIAEIDHATRHLAEPPTPPSHKLQEPPIAKQGILSVSCKPVDCDISIDGNPAGSTANGELSINLKEGDFVVSVVKSDYDSDRKREKITIKDKATTPVEFTLTPSRAALEATGAKLFQQMIEAVSGKVGVKESPIIRGTGELNCYDGNGKQTSWDVTLLLKAPDKGRFAVGRGAQKYEVARTEKGMEWSKDVSGSDFESLDFSLRQLPRYQLSEVLRRLQSTSFRIISEELTPFQSVTLHAEGGSESYAITLGADIRPREIVEEAGGLDKGLRIRYSDYAKQGSAFYPMMMEVILPDTKKHGLEMRFSKIELNPEGVQDADFNLKKKGKFLFIK